MGALIAMGIYFMDCAYNHDTPTLSGFLKAGALGAAAALGTFVAFTGVGALIGSAALASFANGALDSLTLLVAGIVGFDAGMATSIVNHNLTPILTHLLGINMALAECNADCGA